MNFYKRFPGDYARDTAHLGLAEHGAYSLLLDILYSTERPLPAARATIYRMLRATGQDEQAAVDSVLDQFFVTGPAGWSNPKADRLLAEWRERSEKARRSAARRWKPEADESENDMRSHEKLDANASKFDATQSPETRVQKPESRNQNVDSHTAAEPPRAGACEPQAAFDIFAGMANRAGLPVPQILTSPRMKAFAICLAACGGMEGWRTVCEKIEASNFVTGGGERGWRGSLDWALRPRNFTRIMEGVYDDQKPKSRSSRVKQEALAILERGGL